MDWNALESFEDWDAALIASHVEPVVIFKYSTRCSISRMAHKLMQQRWELPGNVQPFLLDSLNYRPVSNTIAADLETEHQSPQLQLIRDGKRVHCANHSSIDPVDLLPYL